MAFPLPRRPVFSRSGSAVFAGGRVGDFMALSASIALLVGLIILGLCGCSTVKQSLPVASGSDRPWLDKPSVVEPLPTPPEQPQARIGPVKAVVPFHPHPMVFACDVEQSTLPVVGFMESSTDLVQWRRVSSFPYDGQTHYWTSSAPCFVRAGVGWR